MQRNNSFYRRAFTLVVAGLLLALSFPPYSLPLASCLALIPLLHRWVNSTSARSSFIDNYVAFQITFLAAFSWPLFHAYPSTAFASLTGVVLIPMTMALPFALAHRVKSRLGRAKGFIALISFYLIHEAFWLYSPIAMPSALLGHSLAHMTWINQFADLAGISGLSLWVLIMNLSLFHVFFRPPRRRLALALSALLFTAAVSYSTLRLEQYSKPIRENLNVLMVQPALPAGQWTNANDASRVFFLQSLTDSLLSNNQQRIDLVIWPETALPVFDSSYEEEAIFERLDQWVTDRSISLLTGAITRSTAPVDPSIAFSNSALFISSEGLANQYDKNVLVPFAEHVPFEEVYRGLNFLRVDAGGVAGYQPGNTQPIFVANDTPFGVLICFESLFGRLARNYIKKGASFLTVLSNVGWWGPAYAPPQYLAFSRLRAIESRRAVVVSTVTGHSAVIMPTGKAVDESSWMERDGIRVSVPLQKEMTVYARYGDWLYLATLLTALLMFLLTIKDRH